MKTYLVTGGAGFIGSNFVCHLLESDPGCRVVNLDKLTYAANLDNLREVRSNPRLQFVKGDICNRELVEYLFSAFDIRGVFHLAAESHVDNSIAGPQVFIDTNIQGTFSVLDVARHAWMSAPGTPLPVLVCLDRRGLRQSWGHGTVHGNDPILTKQSILGK
jgi:dTDP-glucose 4,6-dehydratase